MGRTVRSVSCSCQCLARHSERRPNTYKYKRYYIIFIARDIYFCGTVARNGGLFSGRGHTDTRTLRQTQTHIPEDMHMFLLSGGYIIPLSVNHPSIILTSQCFSSTCLPTYSIPPSQTRAPAFSFLLSAPNLSTLQSVSIIQLPV